MKYEIVYTTNNHIWRMQDIAEAHGYTKTQECYWVQIFEDGNGNSIVCTRDDGALISDPCERLAAMLDPQPEETAQETAEADETAEKLENARQALEARTDRSAWDKGVTAYALELLEELTDHAKGGYITAEQIATRAGIRETLLNGASDWNAYSWGGSSLIYNEDIAERLCTPSELKRTRNGERRPNSREEWLDTQARALSQAAARVARVVMEG